MSEQLILRCENSMEGIFSALYDAFEHRGRMEKPQMDSISIAIGDGAKTPVKTLDATTEAYKVEEVVSQIQSKLGFSVYDSILRALCHYEAERASVVFKYLVHAFAKGSGILNETNSYMLRIIEMSHQVENELKKLYSFLNFRKYKEILLAEIEPKCNLIPLMMDHFADRFSNEDFIIFDVNRKSMILHQSFQPCVIYAGIRLPDVEEGDDYYQNLWETCSMSPEFKAGSGAQQGNRSQPSWYRIYMPGK